jgi:hypothetical protein
LVDQQPYANVSLRIHVEEVRLDQKQESSDNMASGVENIYRSVLMEFLQLNESLQPIHYDDVAPHASTATVALKRPLVIPLNRKGDFSSSMGSRIFPQTQMNMITCISWVH